MRPLSKFTPSPTQILAISHSVKDVLGGIPAEQIIGRSIVEVIPFTEESIVLLQQAISVRAATPERCSWLYFVRRFLRVKQECCPETPLQLPNRRRTPPH